VRSALSTHTPQFNSDLGEESRARAAQANAARETRSVQIRALAERAKSGSSRRANDAEKDERYDLGEPLEIDRDRITFYLRLEVQRVDVHMKLEDSSTLGCIRATAFKV